MVGFLKIVKIKTSLFLQIVGRICQAYHRKYTKKEMNLWCVPESASKKAKNLQKTQT